MKKTIMNNEFRTPNTERRSPIQYSLFIILYSIFTSVNSFAQLSDNAGARSSSLGNCSTTLTDVYSMFNNQAGLATIEHTTIAFGTERKFMLNDLSTHIGGVAVPTKSGTFALNIEYFGFKNFSQKKAALAYGRKFSQAINGGIQFDYLNTEIPLYGNKSVFSFEAGLQVKVLKALSIGAHVFNPVSMQSGFGDDERIPTYVKIGFAYTVSDKVLLLGETEKDLKNKPRVKSGVEYKMLKQLDLRGGIETNPFISSFGIGLHLGNLNLDLATSYHQILGVTPSVGLSYQFKQKEKDSIFFQF